METYCSINGVACSDCTPCCGCRVVKENKDDYIKKLEDSLEYFNIHKTLLSSVNLKGKIALDIATKLINQEINNLKE